MYTVPVGQNPSGVVRISVPLSLHNLMSCAQNVPALRKKEIYDICVEYGANECFVFRSVTQMRDRHYSR
jgi:hypothetical protein